MQQQLACLKKKYATQQAAAATRIGDLQHRVTATEQQLTDARQWRTAEVSMLDGRLLDAKKEHAAELAAVQARLADAEQQLAAKTLELFELRRTANVHSNSSKMQPAAAEAPAEQRAVAEAKLAAALLELSGARAQEASLKAQLAATEQQLSDAHAAAAATIAAASAAAATAAVERSALQQQHSKLQEEMRRLESELGGRVALVKQQRAEDFIRLAADKQALQKRMEQQEGQESKLKARISLLERHCAAKECSRRQYAVDCERLANQTQLVQQQGEQLEVLHGHYSSGNNISTKDQSTSSGFSKRHAAGQLRVPLATAVQ